MTQALIDEWKYCKEQETIWNAKRIEVESQLYEIHQANLPDKGTFTSDEGMKITTGYTEEWDQAALSRAYEQWPAGVKFPFAGTWKADGKAVSYLRENAPEMYALIQPALTLKPKKPSFSLKA